MGVRFFQLNLKLHVSSMKRDTILLTALESNQANEKTLMASANKSPVGNR